MKQKRPPPCDHTLSFKSASPSDNFHSSKGHQGIKLVRLTWGVLYVRTYRMIYNAGQADAALCVFPSHITDSGLFQVSLCWDAF